MTEYFANGSLKNTWNEAVTA